MADCQGAHCVTPTYQVHEKVFYEIMQSRLSPGLSPVFAFSDNFPLEQTTSSVKWKSKERDLISKGNGAWIHWGLIDGAGAAMLFTLRDFHGSRLLQGHILALLDLVGIDCQADEEIGCRRMMVLHEHWRCSVRERYSSQTPKWLWQFSAAADQLFDLSDLFCRLGPSDL